MIRIVSIEVFGTTVRGPFGGRMDFTSGLNVFSGRNAFGKSTAITSIPWCLGLEPMFGLQNNDPSRFAAAVRDVIDLGEDADVRVTSSSARVTIGRDDGAMVSLRRAIVGGDRERVEVTETLLDKSKRTSVLQARKDTMSDEAAGLQRFLFEWMGLPRTPLMTLHGKRSEMYLENIAPLFFIDQNEGWTDLFALQVHRYGLQEVNEAAVEFLLGAREALAARFREQEQVSVESRLKGGAERLSERIVGFFKAQGWTLDWSTRGSTVDVAKRWASPTLSEIARKSFSMDVPAERERITKRLASLRKSLASKPADARDLSPAGQASQEVVELKTKRHEFRTQLRHARLQLAEQRSLLHTIEHRTDSSKDVLRLKVKGIGRLEQVECPTCHRDLDPNTFDLTQQSTVSVAAHIDALEKQRVLIRDNIDALEGEVNRLQHQLGGIEERLLIAERALAAVNVAIGTSRESLTKLLTDISSAERELDALNVYARDITALETDVKKWIEEVHAVAAASGDDTDRRRRTAEFETKLRAQLLALGHSAITSKNVNDVRLDERYVPYLGPRRLRSLGSASDHPRLVVAYVLALAQASRVLKGPHPGVVVLDEPQQQNPDDPHVELFLRFLAAASKETGSQVIVTTYLKKDEPARLKREGVSVFELAAGHFLTPVESA
jgi:hypothetical protein